MAYIRKRTKSNGDVVYDCSITIKKHGVIVHRESKTFSKQKTAKDWGMRREVELQNQDVYKTRDYLSIGELIELYLNKFPPQGRSKNFDLNKLLKRNIAQLDAHRLSNKDLIHHVIERNKECSPQTAGNDLIWLNTVFKTMTGIIDLDTDMNIFSSAREVLRNEGLISKSNHRERRPTRDELIRLSRYFATHERNYPMLHLMWFAIYSARRQGEIMDIRWEDVNHSNRTCLLKDIKHPRIRNLCKVFKLPMSAYKIIVRQPESDERIFPYNGKTAGSYFRSACKLLDINNLHWHDFRHEATSRLFERGLSIVQVQQITLHSNWNTLKRYANLNPGDLDI